jgi:hypothetical protein
MSEVAPYLKLFTDVFYCKFLELGKALFEAVNA